MRRYVSAGVLLAIVALAALPALARKKPEGQPDRVVVQHILVGFKRTAPGKVLERSKKEAKARAEKLFERAQAGEDFDAMVKEGTDDRYPGVYRIANWGVKNKPREYERDGLVPAFGDVSFELEVGEIGLASYHAGNSPFGYHIIKRLE